MVCRGHVPPSQSRPTPALSIAWTQWSFSPWALAGYHRALMPWRGPAQRVHARLHEPTRSNYKIRLQTCCACGHTSWILWPAASEVWSCRSPRYGWIHALGSISSCESTFRSALWNCEMGQLAATRNNPALIAASVCWSWQSRARPSGILLSSIGRAACALNLRDHCP